MSFPRSSARAALNRYIRPFFDRLFDSIHADILSVQQDLLTVQQNLDALQQKLDSTQQSADAVHQRADARTDNLQGFLEILDRKADGQTEAGFRLSKQMGDMREELLARLAEATQREVELREAIDTLTMLVAKSVADINEKLDRVPIVVGDAAHFTAEIATQSTDDNARQLKEDVAELFRTELVEVVRMLRMQGDASDQVAEVLGRTMVRLSAEVEGLAEALGSRETSGEVTSPA